jgi:phosphoglycolate phosphatase-like HAD superfamily hydrolase
MEAAKSVKVAAIAVTWGFQSEAILRASHPDHVLTEPHQLLGLLHTPAEVAHL